MKNKTFLAKISAFSIFAVLTACFAVAVPNAKAEDNALQLTQTSAVLGVGQSVSLISVSGSKLKVTSSSKAVRATVYGGNQITLNGLRTGTSTVKACDTYSVCTNISVKVQKNKDLKFKLSRTNLTVKAGQLSTIVTTNGNGISAYSNNQVVTASVDGSNVILSGVRAGSATVTVCSSNRGCLPVFVKVLKSTSVPVTNGNSNNENNVPVSNVLRLSEISVNISNKESKDVTAFTDKTIAATSDSDAVRTAINGNRVTVYGTFIGEANVKICEVGGNCATVFVRVYDARQGNFQVSQTKVDLITGQSIWIGTKYGTGVTVNSNSWSASAKTKGNLVYISATAYVGKAIVYICSKNASCIPVYVNVEAPKRPKLNPGTLGSTSLNVGKTANVVLKNSYYTNYILINNSDPSVVSASIDGGTLTLKGLNAGVATISVCPTSASFVCGTIAVTVNEVAEVNKTNITVSDTSVTMRLHETTSVTASTAKALAAFSDSDAVQTGVSDNRVTLYGSYAGTALVTVCGGNGTCTNVSVKVQP